MARLRKNQQKVYNRLTGGIENIPAKHLIRDTSFVQATNLFVEDGTMRPAKTDKVIGSGTPYTIVEPVKGAQTQIDFGSLKRWTPVAGTIAYVDASGSPYQLWNDSTFITIPETFEVLESTTRDVRYKKRQLVKDIKDAVSVASKAKAALHKAETEAAGHVGAPIDQSLLAKQLKVLAGTDTYPAGTVPLRTDVFTVTPLPDTEPTMEAIGVYHKEAISTIRRVLHRLEALPDKDEDGKPIKYTHQLSDVVVHNPFIGDTVVKYSPTQVDADTLKSLMIDPLQGALDTIKDFYPQDIVQYTYSAFKVQVYADGRWSNVSLGKVRSSTKRREVEHLGSFNNAVTIKFNATVENATKARLYIVSQSYNAPAFVGEYTLGQLSNLTIIPTVSLEKYSEQELLTGREYRYTAIPTKTGITGEKVIPRPEEKPIEFGDQTASPPSDFAYIATSNGTVFLGRKNGTEVWFTKPSYPHQMGRLDFFKTHATIVGMTSTAAGVFIFTDNQEVHLLTGYANSGKGANTLSYKKIATSVGLLTQESIVVRDNLIIWLSQYGFHNTTGFGSAKTTKKFWQPEFDIQVLSSVLVNDVAWYLGMKDGIKVLASYDWANQRIVEYTTNLQSLLRKGNRLCGITEAGEMVELFRGNDLLEYHAEFKRFGGFSLDTRQRFHSINLNMNNQPYTDIPRDDTLTTEIIVRIDCREVSRHKVKGCNHVRLPIPHHDNVGNFIEVEVKGKLNIGSIRYFFTTHDFEG